jgi:hypothetical protein
MWDSGWPTPVTANLQQLPGPPGSFWVEDWFTGPHGRLTPGQETVLLNHVPGSVLSNLARSRAWVARRHIAAWFSYQPASRYWLFQGVFAAILLAFTAAAGFMAVWLAGRRR